VNGTLVASSQAARTSDTPMMYVDAVLPELTDLARRAARTEGVDVAWAELKRQGASWVFRVFIEKANGEPGDVNLADCERVTKRLSVLLDVEDPIDSAYVLEVSSPGLDRPLHDEKDFERFAGRLAQVRMLKAVDGRKRFVGTLDGVEQGDVLLALSDGGGLVRLPMASIDRARLEIDLDASQPTTGGRG